MISPATFREIVSGRRRGVAATLLRGALSAAEMPYALAMRWRNARYDSGRAKVRRAGVPVLSVGNITLGGTGKTPLVVWLAQWLRRRDVRVALISRGYGAQTGQRNDEALELERRLPDVPHLQNADRVAAAQVAVAELESQVILLDDGFQHRRLARDLDIVLLDALEPFGCEHVFPRGLLREPLTGLRRAQAVVLSRADAVSADTRAEIRRKALHHAAHAVWAEAAHKASCLRSSSGKEASLDALSGRRVAAFCGIGNPAGFRHTLTQIGVAPIAWREFPDHHAYSRDDVGKIARWAAAAQADAVLCTAKDLVKLGCDQLGSLPLWSVEIGIEFLSGQTEIETLLARFASTQSGTANR